MRDINQTRRKLTKRVVDEIPYSATGTEKYYCDSDLTGFKLRVSSSCKSYVVERRVNGINRRITIGKHGALTPELARREAIKLLAEMAVGEDPTIKKIRRKVSALTLGEVLEQYLAARKLRPQTVVATRCLMIRCVPDWLDKPITSITPQMIEERHRELPRRTIMGTKGEVQANMAIRFVNTVINYAIDNIEMPDGTPILMVNPVRKLIKNRAWYDEPRQPNVIPDRKLADWYKAIVSLEQTTYRDFYMFLLLTGMRRTETSLLRWEWVDFENRMLTIPCDVTKNGEYHRLPLSNFLIELLNFRKSVIGKSPLVFPNHEQGDKPLYFSDRILKHANFRAGCEFSPHDLRRTFLSMAVKLDIPYQFTKKLANHRGQTDITGGYIFLHAENLRESMQQITDRFVGLMNAKIEDFEPEIALKHHVAVITLKEVLEAYLASKQLRPNTVRMYRSVIGFTLAEWLKTPVSQITAEMVVTRHKQIGRKSISQANSAMSALKSLLNFAAANYEQPNGQPLISSNPVSCLHQKKAWFPEKNKTGFIPDAKMQAWYKAVMALENTTARDYMLFVLFTGLRRTEAASLLWSDIDMESRIINIRKENSHNTRAHRLPMSDFVQNLLTKRLLAESQYVFPGRDAFLNNFRAEMAEVRNACRWYFQLEDLRRSFYRAAEQAGLSAETIRRLANHVDANDIAAGYIPVDVESMRESMHSLCLDLLKRLKP